MSLRAFEGVDAVPRDFDAGRFGRLTWLGLLVAAIGWALLLGATVAGARLAPSSRADFVEIARCLVGSGFALALIGTLQTGFGALNRFFSAVLTRSGPRLPDPRRRLRRGRDHRRHAALRHHGRGPRVHLSLFQAPVIALKPR